MKLKYTFGSAIYIFFMFMVIGCNKAESPEKTESLMFKINEYLIYDKRDNTFVINGKKFDNVVQSSLSQNMKNSIVTVVNNKKVDVIVARGDANDVIEYKSLDSSILFDPVVNNNGDFAFAKQGDKISESKLLLNNVLLDLPSGLYKGLVMNNEFILAHYSDKVGKSNKLLVYYLTSEEFFFYSLSIIPDSFKFLSDDNIYIEGVSTVSNDRMQSVFNIYDNEIQFSNVAEFSGNLDATLAKNALLKLSLNDPGLSLACIDNSLGRLSWFVSYRLDALSYFATSKHSSSQLPYDRFIKNAVDCLLEQYEYDSELSIIGWPTTKYSLSKQSRLSLMVNNAQIAYVLLKLARKSQLNKEQKQKAISIAKDLYDFYESDFDYSHSLYKFQYGIDYWADGIWMPWNMQNTFGLVLLELYAITGEDIYLKRAELLIKTFLSETSIKGDTLLWHYWPSNFYAGWRKDNELSVNSPSREPTVDTLYEDSIHASTNVLFITQYYNRMEEDYEYYTQLRNTLIKMGRNGSYSRFISADHTVENTHLMFLPYHGGGWASLGNSELKNSIAIGIPNIDVFFEGDQVFSYVTFLSDYE